MRDHNKVRASKCIKQGNESSEMTVETISTPLSSHQKGNFRPLSTFYKPLNFQLLWGFPQRTHKTDNANLKRKDIYRIFRKMFVNLTQNTGTIGENMNNLKNLEKILL